jgi:hypothetical protein
MAQQAAIDALKRAEQQLQRELLGAQQAQQEIGKLTLLLRRLLAIIDRQQKLQFATARAAGSTAPVTDLTQLQRTLGADTGQLRNDTASAAPSAASHLGNAQTHMTQALVPLGSVLRSAQPATAASPINTNASMATNAVARQTEALKELYAARSVIEKQLAGLQDQFSPTNAAGLLAEAAATIDQAQLQLQRALTQLQAPPPGLLQSLLQQQQQIVDGLNHVLPRDQPPPSLRQAHSAAAQAAQGLAQMNLPAAVASMQHAQTWMQQAEAGGNDMDGQVPVLARQQAQVRQLAEALLAAQSAVPPADVAQAGQMLANAGEMLAPMMAGQPAQLPASAQTSIQSAQAALAAAAAQAFAGQGSPAQANASAAAEALADAQSALALAQAGLNSQSAAAGQQGQVPGQGQATGDGRNAGQQNAQASPNSKGNGRTGNWSGDGGADGPRRDTRGEGKFTRLPARERAALLQSQAEKYPQEYGPLIEQYLKNLADEAK